MRSALSTSMIRKSQPQCLDAARFVIPDSIGQTAGEIILHGERCMIIPPLLTQRKNQEIMTSEVKLWDHKTVFLKLSGKKHPLGFSPIAPTSYRRRCSRQSGWGQRH